MSSLATHTHNDLMIQVKLKCSPIKAVNLASACKSLWTRPFALDVNGGRCCFSDGFVQYDTSSLRLFDRAAQHFRIKGLTLTWKRQYVVSEPGPFFSFFSFFPSMSEPPHRAIPKTDQHSHSNYPPTATSPSRPCALALSDLTVLCVPSPRCPRKFSRRSSVLKLSSLGSTVHMP